ncbi:MAG: VWA domain-containing protein [Clostridiales bacterium]|nr:VWA domain-containing protein [Clostridiales bacterium]
MKETLTELVFILDRSGSMSRLTDDIIGGFNSMIEKQKKEPGEAVVTTVLFDDKYEILHDHLPLQKVKPLTNKEYFARGLTALLDAVGMTINTVGARLNDTPERKRPGKVIFVITTDGLENSSHEFTRAQIKEMITHQQDKYSWNFVFLGANMDAVKEASTLGIQADFARNYSASKAGTANLFEGVSETMGVMRSAAFDRRKKDQGYCAAMAALDKAEGKKDKGNGEA